MTTGKALNGKPYAGNPHVRFDEGEVASAATPRRGSLLYKKMTLFSVCVFGMLAATGATRAWPDGSAMNAWFADKSPVDEAKLGRQYFASQMLGAKANVPELQTKPLQLTIDWIASQGGGVLVLGPGVWNTSALFFKPGVHLKLEKGAVLKGPADGADTPRRMTRMMGLTFEYNVALVNADHCDGFTLYGEGMIDGNGRKTWKAFWPQRRKSSKFHDATLPRPRNLYVSNSKDVRISGVAIKDSHFWTTHFYKCERLRIDNVRITAPGPKTPLAAPSPDAVDLDVVRDVHVWNSYFDVNDDAVALKGGKYYKCEELPENGGNERILIENCVFGPVCHSAVTCGSEAFLCRNIVVRNCELRGSGNLLNLKSRPDTKQLYEHILVENVSGKCRNVMHMRPWTQWFELPKGVGKQETRAVNVVFRNCNVKGKENVKLDPSFMKLEGYVPPTSPAPAAATTNVPPVCAERGWKLLWSDEFAYPCLGFMELQDLGLFGTCENDIRSTVAMVVFGAMTKGRMGYISDPAIDSSRRAMIFAHCVSTRKFLGVDGETSPYEIETHSEDRMGASVRSIVPLNYPVTTVQFHFTGNGGKGCVLVQTGRTFSNDPDDRACRTKMVVEVTGDFERSYKLWDLWGWHRVTFLGDFKKDVEALAKKIGYRVIYES